MDPATIFTLPEAYADPEGWHAVAARLRREDPVSRIEAPDFDPLYAITKHAGVIEVERQPERFLNTSNSTLAPISGRGPDALLKTLVNIDGAEHRAYRGVTNEWWKPANVRRAFEPRIRELAVKYVGRMAELGGECDFALDIARFYPLQVITIDNAVEETIRWVTPVRHFLRHAQEDYVLRGTQLRKGDALLMSYLSANRDEDVFSESHRFDATRENAGDHLTFGTGVHFCLGALLARMELRAFYRELPPRLESVELTGPTAYTAATFVGAPKRVPIRYQIR